MSLSNKELARILFDIFMAEEDEDEPTLFDVIRRSLTPEKCAEVLSQRDCESCRIRSVIKCTSRDDCYENCLRVVKMKVSEIEKLINSEETDEPEEDI